MNASKIYTIPNFLTLLNLFSGSCAVISIFFAPEIVGLFIGFSLLMDFLYGMVARWLKIQSNIGKDLDSLADIVSFGLVPTFMLLMMVAKTKPLATGDSWSEYIYFFPPFLIVLFSALRLAKFNNDVRDSYYFYGLNTPTTTLFVYGFFSFLYRFQIAPQALSIYYIVLVCLILLLCFLMISDVKMYSNKMISKDIKQLWPLLIVLLVAIVCYAFFGFIAFSVAVFTYVLLSVLFLNVFAKK
ncbi:MAG: CDP-alcohol phosphatidyltransferase family protein [Thermoflexibacteraceae bacterium]